MLKDEMILWVDVETSGLDPHQHYLLEIAAVMTDMQGSLRSGFFHERVKIPDLQRVMNEADSFALDIHSTNGLWEELWSDDLIKDLHQIDKELKDFIKKRSDPWNSIVYLGGNSPSLDRNFVKVNLPESAKELSHRSIDMTSISLFLKSNYPYKIITDNLIHSHDHRALYDVKLSLKDYISYKEIICSDRGK